MNRERSGELKKSIIFTLGRELLTWKHLVKVPSKRAIQSCVQEHHLHGQQETEPIPFHGAVPNVAPLQPQALFLKANQVLSAEPKRHRRQQALQSGVGWGREVFHPKQQQ